MFGNRFFGERFFGDRYFGAEESSVVSLSSRLLGSFADSTDGTGAKTTGSFTPNDGERIYLISTGSATVDATGYTFSITGGQTLGIASSTWTRIVQEGAATGVRVTQAHEAGFTAMARSMTLSLAPGTSMTGHVGAAIGVMGFPKVRQVKKTTRTAGAAAAPSITFDNPVASGSLILAAVYIANTGAGTGLTVPSGFSALYNGGYTTPTVDMQVVARDSGFSGSTITWGSTTTSNWNIIAIELEAGRASDMNHYRAYGANTTEQVLRIQYPDGGYDGTKGYVVGPPSNQWNWTLDVHPQDNVLEDVRLRGFPTVFICYRKRGTADSPAQIQDFHAGLQWVISNASTYQLDPTKVAAFGISAGAHIAAMAALTGGESDVGGAATPIGHIRAVYWQFGHNRARMISPFCTQYGITFGRTAPCSAGSVEEDLMGALPCSLASFDWISGDSGSLSTAKTAVYNQTSPGFWAGQWAGTSGQRPKFNLWHGTADDQIPYGCTYNPKSGGTGHALDNGLHQDLVNAGFNSQYTLLVGSGHGGNEFQPSSNASATNGAAVDAAVVWLLTNGGHISSGGSTSPVAPSLPVRRRRSTNRSLDLP